MLEIGTKAPDFTLPDKDGNLVERYYDPEPVVGNDIYPPNYDSLCDVFLHLVQENYSHRPYPYYPIVDSMTFLVV